MENSGRRAQYSGKESYRPIYKSKDGRRVAKPGLTAQLKKIRFRVDAWSPD